MMSRTGLLAIAIMARIDSGADGISRMEGYISVPSESTCLCRSKGVTSIARSLNAMNEHTVIPFHRGMIERDVANGRFLEADRDQVESPEADPHRVNLL